MLENTFARPRRATAAPLKQSAKDEADDAAILGLGTAVPGMRMPQDAIYEEVLAPLLGSNPHARAIFQNAGVGARHLAVEKNYYHCPRSTEERNARYLAEALPLAAEAIHDCLSSGGWGPQHVDDLIVASCTGIDTPGLDLRLAALFDMRPDLHRATILGMGCYAALPSLLRAVEAARAGRRVLVVAVELCSLHFQPDDDSTENVVSAALFADGAAAVLVGPQSSAPFRNGNGNGYSQRRWPTVLDFETLCEYNTFDQMGFHLTNNGFQMRLGSRVPDVLSTNVQGFVQRLLKRNSLQHDDVAVWAVHPGSSKILDGVERQLALASDALQPSRAVLQRYGNMSSPTILFVLNEIQRRRLPSPGAYGVVLGFGPGLTMEGALVRW